MARRAAQRPGTQFIPLEGCEIAHVTDRAVLVFWVSDNKNEHGENEEMEEWVPRSVCENGAGLSVGDEDIRVQQWFVEKYELPS